jgi:cytochrome b subunit of formate dehydrogenase
MMLEEQIKNSNEESISRNICITKQYSKIIHVLVLLSKILIIISGLLSFSSTKFEYWLISFSSGSLNFLATSLLSYSSFLQIEKKKITKSLNQKLQILGIKEKLLISNDGSDDSDKSQWLFSKDIITRNIEIVKQYTKVIHVLNIISRIIIIISGLLSFGSTKFEYWAISFSSGSLNFLATSLISYSSFLSIEKKKITKNLNHKLEILEIKQKLLVSDGSDDSDKSQWQLKPNSIIMDVKSLVKEIDIKQEIIIRLNYIVIQQDRQIEYYKQSLKVLHENINLIKQFLDES